MPLLLLGLLRLQRGPVGWLWIVLMGVSFGLTFHVGFTQAALYLNGFFCLAVLVPGRDGLAAVEAGRSWWCRPC